MPDSQHSHMPMHMRELKGAKEDRVKHAHLIVDSKEQTKVLLKQRRTPRFKTTGTAGYPHPSLVGSAYDKNMQTGRYPTAFSGHLRDSMRPAGPRRSRIANRKGGKQGKGKVGKSKASGGADGYGPDSLFGPDLQRGANPKVGSALALPLALALAAAGTLAPDPRPHSRPCPRPHSQSVGGPAAVQRGPSSHGRPQLHRGAHGYQRDSRARLRSGRQHARRLSRPSYG